MTARLGRSRAIVLSPCQGELQREAEVAGGGGIRTAGEERRVGLLIVVGRDGHQTTQGVVGHERDFEGAVTAGG